MYKKTLQISFILIICMIVGIVACITDGISETFSAVRAINYSRSEISEIFETESGKALLSSFQSSEAYMPDALEEISLETPVWAFITFEGESLSKGTCVKAGTEHSASMLFLRRQTSTKAL